MRVLTLPPDDPPSGWYAMLPSRGSVRQLRENRTADWIILGAGVTGLAAARQLVAREPNARVTVIDALRVGQGASGRNSGFVLDSPHYDATADIEENRGMVRLNRAGMQLLEGLVAEHGMKCDWRRSGHMQVAVGNRGDAALRDYCRVLDEVQEPYEACDGNAIAAATGSAYYRGGAYVPSTAIVQPAALVRGLADSLPPGIELFEESPVHDVRLGNTIRVECAQGSVEAQGLLLACNAFTPALGFLGERVLPLLTFASLTRPLTTEQQRALGGRADWALLAADPMGTTVLRTPDHRILIRNCVRYRRTLRVSDAVRREIAVAHAEAFRRRFPQLGEPDFEYAWHGIICMAMNEGTFFGPVAPGVFASLCYNGAGLSRGTIGGTLLADLALGVGSDLLTDIQASPRPSWIPPDPLRGVGVKVATGYMQWRSRAER